MSDVVIKARVLHETDHALLLDINGRQEWVSRQYCRHKSIHNGEIEIAEWLANRLGAQQARIARQNPYSLDELLAESAVSDGLAITPKPNQPHQQEAFEKLYKMQWFALFMQMRAGKTKVAIDIVCNHYANGRIDRVLWLCPNSATATAEQQWRQHAVIDVPRKIVALETVSGCGELLMETICAWYTPNCAIIIDESQMIKNSRAKRSRRLEKMLLDAPVKGILSGTPITQNIQDLYNQIKALDWRIFGYRNAWQFQQAHLVMSEKFPGLIRDTKNTQYLSDRLQPFVFEWFSDYSDRRASQTVYIDMSDIQRELIWEIKEAVLSRMRSNEERTEDIYLLFTAIHGVLSGYVSARIMRRIFGRNTLNAVHLHSPKLDALENFVRGLDEQKIIWCTRLHELSDIAEKLPEAITVSGEINAAERHRRIQTFRKSRTGTLVAMVQVAKRAIEMSECNEVIYYGHSFDFESREQSQWRTLLPNKTAVVRYTDLIYRDSLDERIRASHAKKRNVVREFMDLLRQDRELALNVLERL